MRARVAYHDGQEEEIRVQDLPRFVTERDNPGNRLGVANASLSFPAEELRDGVFLVDTPEVGSVYRPNTDAARAFLPEADAAIFLTSADPPISDAERSFLEEVRDEAARMFFVLNKADYLTGLDRDEAIAFTRGVIVDAVGHDVPLYPMSAKQALIAKLVGGPDELEASGLPAFERDLRAFLLHEKGRAILDSVSGRALRLVDAERNSIDVKERALELSERELEEVLRRMEEVFARARTTQRDVHALLRNEVQELVSILEADLEALRSEEERRLLALGRRHLSEREDPSAAAQEVDRLVKDGLRADLERWRAAQERKLTSAFRESTERSWSRPVRPSARRCGCAARSWGSSSPPSPFPSTCPRRRGSASTSSRSRRSWSRSCRTSAASCPAGRPGACWSGTSRGGSRSSWTSTAGACATISSRGWRTRPAASNARWTSGSTPRSRASAAGSGAPSSTVAARPRRPIA